MLVEQFNYLFFSFVKALKGLKIVICKNDKEYILLHKTSRICVVCQRKYKGWRFCFFFFLWPHRVACGILVFTKDQPCAPEVEVRSPNHCTSRKFPGDIFVEG